MVDVHCPVIINCTQEKLDTTNWDAITACNQFHITV